MVLKDKPSDTDDIVVHKGLPGVIFRPLSGLDLPTPTAIEPGPSEQLSETDMKFNDVYKKLEGSDVPEQYVSGLKELVGMMIVEVEEIYGPLSGDLANTMKEWATSMVYVVDVNTNIIKQGKNASNRSNTHDGRNKPHGSDGIGRDDVSTKHSADFAGTVVRYIAKRGGRYIVGDVVRGEENKRRDPYSTSQVETFLQGFRNKIDLGSEQPTKYSLPPSSTNSI